MTFWQNTKLWTGEATGLPDSTLHALVGMMLLYLGALMLRRTPWNWRPWLLLLALELANETYDMLNPASGEDRLGASIHDLWLTMFCPTLMLILTPLLLRAARRAAPADAQAGGESGD